MPLLDRVRSNTRSASTEKFGANSQEGGEMLIMHHSRDTEAKQWIETCIQVGGIKRTSEILTFKGIYKV